MSKEAQFVLILVGTGLSGFVLSVVWGRITRPRTFDRDAMLFFAKMWFGAVVVFLALYFALKYKVL